MLEQKIKELMEALEQDQQGDPYANGNYIYGVQVTKRYAEVHMQWPRWLKWVESRSADVTYEARRVPGSIDDTLHITASCGDLRAVVVLTTPEMAEILKEHQVVLAESADVADYWFCIKHYECL